MSHTSLRRGVAALGVAALAATGLAAAPAQAGLLDPLQPVLGSVLDPVLSTVNGITGELVPTGWLYDGSATTMREVRSAIGADTLWSRGYTGRGVGVALVDTGVVPVPGLDSGNVTNGADLSFESQAPSLRYLDTFGHGTHLAGIIAGRTSGGPLNLDKFQGVAPDAKLTSLKMAASDGAVDVSQVIAAVDWVVAPRRRRQEPHPGSQPLLRDRRHPGLPGGPAHPCGGERLARRHRGGRLGRQRRVGCSQAEQPRL